jgi:hypothetical protein
MNYAQLSKLMLKCSNNIIDFMADNNLSKSDKVDFLLNLSAKLCRAALIESDYEESSYAMNLITAIALARKSS